MTTPYRDPRNVRLYSNWLASLASDDSGAIEALLDQLAEAHRAAEARRLAGLPAQFLREMKGDTAAERAVITAIRKMPLSDWLAAKTCADQVCRGGRTADAMLALGSACLAEPDALVEFEAALKRLVEDGRK